MAHIATRVTDFTHPIKRNGSMLVTVKQAVMSCLRALAGKTVQNGNATTVNASIVQTNIAGISFKVRKNKQYRIKGVLLASTGATPGLAVGIALPGSSAATGTVNYTYLSAAAGATQVITGAAVLSSASTGAAVAVLEVDIEGFFIPDVSGIVTITFAQNTSNATNSTILAGSNITVYRTFS